MADEEGFERPLIGPTTVFKTVAINHAAIPVPNVGRLAQVVIAHAASIVEAEATFPEDFCRDTAEDRWLKLLDESC